MARRCDLTGVGVQTGNNVSHANNKTRRRFLPNLQVATFKSDLLKREFRMRVTAKALRSIEHRGGFDKYVMGARAAELPEDMRPVRRKLLKAVAEVAA